MSNPVFWGKIRKIFTVFDLITALCVKVFKNYREHSAVVKYVSTCSGYTIKKSQKRPCLMIIMHFFLILFIKAYVVGTHLNCIDLSMQFK